MNLKYDEFIEVISNQKYYIYGAGKVAARYYRILEEKGLLRNFQGFVVSDIKSHNKQFDKKLFEINEINNDVTLLLAVDYTAYTEIESSLVRLGYYKYYWGYPYLYDLYLGKPVISCVNVNIEEILTKNITANWMAICFLAMEDNQTGNERGKNIYLKIARHSFGSKMAKKDFERFMNEVNTYRNNGYVQKYAIKINLEKTLLLDGAHRIAIATYFGRKRILADLYQCSIDDYRKCYGIDDTKIRVSSCEDGAIEKILDAEEIRVIKKTLIKMCDMTREKV